MILSKDVSIFFWDKRNGISHSRRSKLLQYRCKFTRGSDISWESSSSRMVMSNYCEWDLCRSDQYCCGDNTCCDYVYSLWYFCTST
ncbi:hypothetical protein Anas_14332 [Armadillidium nasatum]|uniref:Uncharacterized protein n=1 Tax=Armadillidium nasatum TaxID=96803 RepID=A0A5N5T4W8_9CRUS|nr:hypothetical protein Anas_14332 [Armadillidium nasatum]